MAPVVLADISLIRLLRATAKAERDHEGSLFVFSPEGDAAVILQDDEGNLDWVPMEFYDA